MYCPVYSCNSDSQKTTSPATHFFSFPSGKSADMQHRRKAWIEFSKQKAFQPSPCTRMCSLHFAKDACKPGSSPELLERLQLKEKVLVCLKKDALPTLKKPLESPSAASTGKTRDYTVRRQQRKVRFFFAYTCLENIGMHVHIMSIAAFNEHQLLIHMFILY